MGKMTEAEQIERLRAGLEAIAINPQLGGKILAGIAKNILDSLPEPPSTK